MRLVLKSIDYKKYIPVGITALLLFSSICLTGSNVVIIYAGIAFISLEYIIYMLITRNKVLLNTYDAWLILVFLMI